MKLHNIKDKQKNLKDWEKGNRLHMKNGELECYQTSQEQNCKLEENGEKYLQNCERKSISRILHQP